jgi:hypothetical protein
MITNVSMLSGLCFVFAVAFFGLYLGVVKDAPKDKIKLVSYLIIAGFLISLLSLLGLATFIKLSSGLFIVALIYALIIGALHCWLFEKIVTLEKKNGYKILFTFAVCSIGYGLFIISFKLFFKSPFPRIYFLPAFLFILPTFVLFAFEKYILIPQKVYKVWSFPMPGTLPDPSDNEMTDPIIVNFEISKQNGDSLTVFKAKAPRGMILGKLFYFFIMDYNSHHPDNPISTSGDENKPFMWSFCLSAGFLSGKIRLDPEITISENGIKENSSVICERITLY